MVSGHENIIGQRKEPCSKEFRMRCYFSPRSRCARHALPNGLLSSLLLVRLCAGTEARARCDKSAQCLTTPSSHQDDEALRVQIEVQALAEKMQPART